MAYAKLIGAQVKRKEDPRLIRGQGTYVGDLKIAGMHYVAFVRSPYAHARINSIDTSAALQRPGVVAVVTGQEFATLCGLMPMASSSEGGVESAEGEASQGDSAEARNRKRSHYALSVARVRHVGEAVAAVIAASAAVADNAVDDVLVDWEPLPAVVDPVKAAQAGSPTLFDDMQDNIEHVWKRKHGDVEAAFAQAEHVVKQHILSQRLAGVSMEGRAVVAMPDPATGGLTVWTSTQAPHWSRRDIAKVLGLPENAVHVIAPDVGGGFGVKIGIYPEDIALAALAREYQLPLRWVETRSEHMMATTHGRAQVADLEAAVAADGTISALRMRVLGDLGAYPLAPGIPNLTGEMGVGVYKIPAVDIEIRGVFTNTTPVAAYRGAGRPEAAYYLERLVNVIAYELNLDPVEVRRKNFIPPDAFPYHTPTGKVYDTGEYEKALNKALEVSNYAALRAEQAQQRAQMNGSNPPSRLLGIGVACYVEMCGFGPYESAAVRVEPTGTVTVSTGISPHGQGGGTTFAQIVADHLGVDFNKIVVNYGDTATTPMGNGTMGSRSLVVGGSALVRAAGKVRDKAQRIAGHLMEVAAEDIELKEGRYQVKGVPGRSLSLAEIADRAYSDKLPDDIEPGLEAGDFFKPPELVYPFGAHVAVVEIEQETGAVHVRDFFSVDDCGPRISPMLVEGQVHGGLAQGIGQALLEEIVYDENGQLLSGSLMDYALPHAEFFPQFTLDRTETSTPLNPLGAKGIGEAATIGSTPAVVNAVMDALQPFGVRHLDMPLRPEKVWRAMNPNP